MDKSSRQLAAVLVAIALLAIGCGSNEAAPVPLGADGAVSSTSLDSTTTTAPDHDDQAASGDLQLALDHIVEETEVPALGAAIFDSTGRIGLAVAGSRQRGGSVAATADDIFHIGSNTKAMTAALVARLDEQGGPIGFDTSLGDAFGGSDDIHPDFQPVTLAQLLSHTGGAPTDEQLDVDDSLFELPASEGRALGSALVVESPPSWRPGVENAYSNAGYVLVAAALESLTDATWEELMVTEVFEPLSMASCGFGPPGVEGADDQPSGHDSDTGQPVYFDIPELLAPAGGIHCSLDDWGRFLVELLNGYRGDSDYLAKDTVHRLFQPADAPVDGFSGGAALGWLVADGPEGTAFFHNGSNTAWFSQAAILPDIDRVVVAAGNEASSGEQATALAFAALNDLYPG